MTIELCLLCCSQPANKYPGTFSASGIFGHFPFSLPTIIAAFLSLVGEYTAVIKAFDS